MSAEREREDPVPGIAALPRIQESVESPGFDGLNLSYQERRIYHRHEELDRRIGAQNVPAGLRVPPLLAPYVTAA
jgi:hypothetical protein